MANPSDKLAAFLGQIESWCTERKVLLIRGEVEKAGQLPEVLFMGEAEASPSDFLQALSQAPVSALVVHAVRLTRDDWQDKIDELEDAETPEDKARLRQVLDCENLIDCVRCIGLEAFVETPKLVLKFALFANWHNVFSDNNSSFPCAEEQYEREDPRTSPRVEELARRVAIDPRFAAAKKQADKQYVAKTVLRGEEIGAGVLFHIAQQAASIFELEIKPALDEELAKKVNSLRRAGQSPADIAKSLKLTSREVNRLLD